MEAAFEPFRGLLQFASGKKELYTLSNFSDEIKAEFSAILTKVDLPKGSILNIPGRKTDKIYLVESGLITTSCLLDGKEVGTGFYAEGNIGGDIISFLTGHRSQAIVRTVEPSTVYILEKKEFDLILRKYPETEIICRLLYKSVILTQQFRIENLIYRTSIDKYKWLLKKYPTIVHRLPLGFIATYLGISQETLSRVRSQKYF